MSGNHAKITEWRLKDHYEEDGNASVIHFYNLMEVL